MDLDDFETMDGRPVAFDRQSVSLIMEHDSGEGLLVVLGTGAEQRALHIKGEYQAVRNQIAESGWDRATRTAFEKNSGSLPF